MKITCAYCGMPADLPKGHVNRSLAQGLRMFCDRKCSGLGRRKNKTKAQKVEEKRLYDIEYRRLNSAVLKVKKSEYHKASYDPAKQRAYNQKRMPQHVEYCRRPEYRRRKQEYDRQHRADKFGPFAEAYMLTIELNREIKGRMTNHEIKCQNQTVNKTQRRRREGKEETTRTRPRNRWRRNRDTAAIG